MSTRFLRVGEDWGHQSRVKSAVITKMGSILKFKDLRKTHYPIAEGMLAEYKKKVNTIENVKELVVWSKDIEKLYPSLKAEEVSKLVGKAFLEYDLEVNVNT